MPWVTGKMVMSFTRREIRKEGQTWSMIDVPATPNCPVICFPNIPQSLFLPGICKDCVPSLFLHLCGLCFLSFPWVIPPQISGLGFSVITSMVSTTPGRSGSCSLLLLSLLPSFISFNFFFTLSPTLSDEPCGFLTTPFLPHGTPYEMLVGCLYEWVSYKTLDIWAPSSKEGSEIRDMDLGVISWWKQFPLNWWSHSPRRWKRFFQQHPEGQY